MTCCRNFWRQSGTIAAHSLVIPAMCCKSSSAARRARVRSQMPLCAMFAPRLVCSSWTDRIGTKPGHVRIWPAELPPETFKVDVCAVLHYDSQVMSVSVGPPGHCYHSLAHPCRSHDRTKRERLE